MKEYTAAEVADHREPNDLWIIVDGKVFNMTPYFTMHPGGRAMLRQAGKDASLVIRAVAAHSLPWKFIESKLAECQIGVLKKE